MYPEKGWTTKENKGEFIELCLRNQSTVEVLIDRNMVIHF